MLLVRAPARPHARRRHHFRYVTLQVLDTAWLSAFESMWCALSNAHLLEGSTPGDSPWASESVRPYDYPDVNYSARSNRTDFEGGSARYAGINQVGEA